MSAAVQRLGCGADEDMQVCVMSVNVSVVSVKWSRVGESVRLVHPPAPGASVVCISRDLQFCNIDAHFCVWYQTKATFEIPFFFFNIASAFSLLLVYLDYVNNYRCNERC